MNLEQIRLLKASVGQLEFNMSWRLKEQFGCCGITLAQWQIITELGNKEEICIVELAELLGVDSSTLSRTVNRMVEADLVDRITNCSDRRYVSLTLTKKGEELYQYVEDRDNHYYAKVFELIPEEKREQVLESLVLFTDALKACKKSVSEEDLT